MSDTQTLRNTIEMRRLPASDALDFVLEQYEMLERENAALREKLVQALAIARKYEPDEKTSYVKYASDEIVELLKEKGK